MKLNLKHTRTFLWNFSLHFTLFIVVLGVFWKILAFNNFGYDFFYETMEIKLHIDQYGPQNKYRKGFATTTDNQRKANFAAIVTSIHEAGSGLADITFTPSNGNTQKLLRKPEVIHLQDVAHFIELFLRCAGLSFLLLIGLIWLGLRFQLMLLPLGQTALLWFSFIATTTTLLLIIGPVKVFYWFHEKLFPPEHEWFFYYQDSLMTTLMKAPDLFGAITALWVGLSLVSFILCYQFCMKRYNGFLEKR